MCTCVVPTREQSLNNLRIAFNQEANTAERYLAFAIQAGEEGYLKSASLYRALARSEQIHAANHASLLREMGSNPRSAIEVFELKSTAENLRAALADELHEIAHMYPEFLREADAAMLHGLQRSFHLALLCKKAHARLLEAMLERIERADAAPRPSLAHRSAYYVCSACGHTVEEIRFKDCPVCGASREDFEWWIAFDERPRSSAQIA